VVSSVYPLTIVEPLLESLGFNETTVKSTEAIRSRDEIYLGFCCWRGRLVKEVSRRILARETVFLGGWLSDGLPITPQVLATC
jgi:hypothetical protein